MSESSQVPAVPRTFRLPVELDRRIGVRAERDFVGPLGRPNKTRVVVEALEAWLSAPGPVGVQREMNSLRSQRNDAVVELVEGATANEDKKSEVPAPRALETTDLVRWLSWGLGWHRSVCRAYVDAGRVSVGGRPVPESCRNVGGLWLVELPVPEVLVDGAPVSGG